MEQFIEKDPEYLKRRKIELQERLKPYMDELARIENIMPLKYKCHLNKDGSFDPLTMERIIEPEWQRLIDKIKQAMNDFIKSEFPEFANR